MEKQDDFELETPTAAVSATRRRSGRRVSGRTARSHRSNPQMDIRVDDLTHPAVLDLIRFHLEGTSSVSPPESTHALGVESLRQPDVTVWTAWIGGDLAGCGALKEIGPTHGEVKSMRTAPEHLRQGVAAALLRCILAEAEQRGYRQVSLETGSMDAFEPARQLYTRFGFAACGPFGNYRPDRNSVFMTRSVGDPPSAA